MPDMLVSLSKLPLTFDFIARAAADGVTLRKPIGPEKLLIAEWIGRHFSDAWASEFNVTMSRWPATSFIATESDELIGFACYDATGPGLFGPIGVREQSRGRGVGTGLLMACLQEMKLAGYAYAIIGAVGPTEFYEKCCGAVVIPDSTPGIWKGMLRRRDD